MSDGMYSEIILEYYRHPVNFGELKPSDAHSHDTNTLCGDDLDMYINFEGDKIKEIRFKGKGCAISQASASMLTEKVIGKSIDDIKKMNKDDILNMLGIEVSATRIKCALLGLKVLKMAVYTHAGDKMSDEERKSL